MSTDTIDTPKHCDENSNTPEVSPEVPEDRDQHRSKVDSSTRTVRRNRLVIACGVTVCLVAIAIAVWPTIRLSLVTVSTDDAFVNSHVTYLAPRVVGQVMHVFVDDNDRVSKGDVLIQLDPVPYKIAVEQKRAVLESAQADLVAANASVHALVAQTRANRYLLENAIQQVDQKIANLRSSVATYVSQQASLELSRSNLRRAENLAPSGAISQQELDINRQAVKADVAHVDEALQLVYASRVSLGLTADPSKVTDLTEVPDDLDQNYSSVRASLASLNQSAAQLGYFTKSLDASPRQTIEEFYKQDPLGDLDRIFAQIIPNAPPIKQAEAKLLQAQRDLEKAELDLLYCKVVSEIDGFVTRRNVNPGNNVQIGQSLMAVRSLTEIWIDANFKETQLANLRIGQRVDCEVDMYGRKEIFEGHITGFTMGTGQTLSLLPPQNATGNFVKIVQRLPVRIELDDYEFDKRPLFVGLSVTSRVHYKEPAKGAYAGMYLRPSVQLQKATSAHKPIATTTPDIGKGDTNE